MHPSSWFDAYEDSSLQVLRKDAGLVLCRRRGFDREPVLLLFPAAEPATPGSLNRLSHEHGLKDDLDRAWAARPLELVRERGRTALVLEDPGGEPLDRLLGRPLDLGRFLRLAISLSAAVGRMHDRGLVHKDIKPANVLVDSATEQVCLTGFGIASRLPRERQAPAPPEIIAGTFAYMAPEQTGRMNRSVDARSDLYSLGVTLYEMLTGTLPFAAERADGMDPLPHRPPADAARRAGGQCPCAGRIHRPEAAGQVGRGPLPDRGRPRGGPARLPDGLGDARPHRPFPARQDGRLGPAG